MGVRSILFLSWLLGTGAGAAAQEMPPFAELAKRFDYDASQPLDPEVKGVEKGEGFEVRDLTYASPVAGRVTAYLLVPDGAGPFPAVVFQHPGRPGNRTAFLAEARDLARAGVVSLLPDAPFARPEPWRRPADPNDHREDDRHAVQAVVDLRRGIDLLAGLPQVDAKRIGYVGHSFGASQGGVLAGVEKRIRAFVLMAGGGSLSNFLRTSDNPEIVAARKEDPAGFERYVRRMAPFDPERYVGHAAPAHLLYQMARQDEAVPESEAKRYFAAGSEPKTETWYDARHALNEEARRDRLAWLGDRLGFRPAPAAGASAC